MGMTDRQLLWKVELPLACPRSSPGCGSPPSPPSRSRPWRSSPAAAASATELIGGSNITFKTGDRHRRRARDPDRDRLRPAAVLAQRLLSPWRRVQAGMSRPCCPSPTSSSSFGDAIDFIFSPQPSEFAGGEVGGPDEVLDKLDRPPEVERRWRSRSRVADRAARSASASATAAAARASRRDRQRRPGHPRAGADRVHGRLRRRRVPERHDRAAGPRHPADPHQRLRRHPPGRPRRGRGGAGHGDERAARSSARSSCRWRCRRS